MKASTAWMLLPTLILAACQPRTGEVLSLTPPAGHVNITVNCSRPSGDLSAVVAPWRQQVKQDSIVVWNLNGNNAHRLTITPHDTLHWPFENKLPSGDAGKGISSGRMLPGRPLDTPIPYTVTVECGDSIRVIIDPELIIPTT